MGCERVRLALREGRPVQDDPHLQQCPACLELVEGGLSESLSMFEAPALQTSPEFSQLENLLDEEEHWTRAARNWSTPARLAGAAAWLRYWRVLRPLSARASAL